MTMAFHSYDQHLVVANEHDIVAYVFLPCCLISQLIVSQSLGLVAEEEIESVLQW